MSLGEFALAVVVIGLVAAGALIVRMVRENRR